MYHLYVRSFIDHITHTNDRYVTLTTVRIQVYYIYTSQAGLTVENNVKCHGWPNTSKTNSDCFLLPPFLFLSEHKHRPLMPSMTMQESQWHGARVLTLKSRS